MSFSVRILKDELTPAAVSLKAGLSNLRPVLEAVGLEMVSITQQSFFDESQRAAPWAPKWGGAPSNLVESGTLRRSIRIVNIGGTTVIVGTDRIYAAIHQFGGIIRAKDGGKLRFKTPTGWVTVSKVTMPPRPFFPFTPAGSLTSNAQEKIGAVLDKSIRAYLPPA